MLEIVVPASECYNEATQEFISVGKDVKLQMEHSLISISKWEAKHHKAFLSKRAKTKEEMDDYFRCMTINKVSDPSVFSRLTGENIKAIEAYISDPMTATYMDNDAESQGPKDTVTSELIYYWMVSYRIPSEFQKWHINRLMALIHVCGKKNSPPKKMSKTALAQRNAALNAKRRAAMNSRG